MKTFIRICCIFLALAFALSSCASHRKKHKRTAHRTHTTARKAPTRTKAAPTRTAAPTAASSNASASPSVVKVIETARTYTGTPYKYGGTTRKGMDCSGLLCTSFQSINMTIPRVSRDQATIGPAVKVEAVRPGDLLFFSTSKSRKGINHVGLVTEVSKGRIQFIHATSSLGVMEDNLFSDYYKRAFVKAIRPRYD